MTRPPRPMLTALALAAFALSLPAAAVAQTPPAEKLTPAVDPPIYDPDLDGRRAIESAAQYGNRTSRRIILDFGTNDCAPCRTVNRALHEPNFYQALTRDFLLLSVDVTPGSKNAGLLKVYGLDAKKGLPALVIFDLTMKVTEATKNGEMVALAKKGDRAVQEWLLARFPKPE